MRILCFMICAGLVAACGSAAAGDYRIETVAEGLDHPWSIAFLPDGRMLVTERAGRLRIIEDGRLLEEPVRGVPEAYVRSQAGLFEVKLDPDFQDNGWIYLSLAHGTAGANSTRVVRGRLAGGEFRDLEVLFTADPPRNTPVHYGGRMAFLADGTLAIGLGDGFNFREDAQRLDSHTGTIVRIHRDGTVPADNPFVGRNDARPEIYSYGHRNVQGLVHDEETGLLWAHEHGPRGGDELNLIQPGENYGWPLVTRARDYGTEEQYGETRSREGYVDPVYEFLPTLAPSGLALVTQDRFPQWRGNLLAGGLRAERIRRVVLEDDIVVHEEELLLGLVGRIRDVREGPDGNIYVLSDERDGALYRVESAR